MRETEVTYEVFDDLNAVDAKLKAKGFKNARRFILEDHYFSHLTMAEIAAADYETLINNSFLVRSITENDNVGQKLCYKKKEYDELGNVVSEEKIAANIDSAAKARQIFISAGLSEWCALVNNSCVYQNGNREIAIQAVEGLGVFMEIEEDETIQALSSGDKLKELIAFAKSTSIMLGDDFSCKKVYMKLKKNQGILSQTSK